MKIDFKQPKYVLPAIALPFLILFYYAWQSGFSKKGPELKPQSGLNATVANVSADVRKKNLSDKLDAYRNTYKDADGLTAVNVIPKETSANPTFHDHYSGSEKRTLDSIEKAMKARYAPLPVDKQDIAIAPTIEEIERHRRQVPTKQPVPEPGPMDIFKQQMAYIDSVGKMNDPEYKAQKLKRDAAEQLAKQNAAIPALVVRKDENAIGSFNTVRPGGNNGFISAIIDESITGYAGSRLRLRLLEDIRAGDNLVPKGTFLYAQISGFSEQRVGMVISSVVAGGRILPVRLQVYDLDGLPGLYVPSSAFRDFTKDLGGNSVQGVTLDGTSGSQFIMSSVSKMFQSTSSAIAELIRKNKAKLKYNSFIYLIDNDSLQTAQKN
ncbi:Bacteroides conjugative transposon TraM protein [Mucilaginibacter gossypiicola]|uniref:Bacteroides conjugative transposon TraM protein n=1 Tax=Mucilaginibacter gossypiicola TaxID=551995 RepID=A0A1H8LYU5_9SPHI|nr:conjugative transposon protein TraM [Mucilaginibacter gossypiicola]SEO10275.1 Bacteroides conjugative transposon TraM protein [Mucilaginibacter gossypiicola]